MSTVSAVINLRRMAVPSRVQPESETLDTGDIILFETHELLDETSVGCDLVVSSTGTRSVIYRSDDEQTGLITAVDPHWLMRKRYSSVCSRTIL